MATEQRIDLIKKVYSKSEYPRIIDTKFNQLGVMSVNEQLATTITVNQFFEYYNELFYEIPAFGATNYLILYSFKKLILFLNKQLRFFCLVPIKFINNWSSF